MSLSDGRAIRSLLRRIAELEESGPPAAIVTVVRSAGSTPREPGARMIVHSDGRIEGTIGGGKVESAAAEAALRVIEHGRPAFLELALTQELGMCCGGTISLFIEAILRAPHLIIFGAGHVGTALTRMAAHAGFIVHVADERDDLLDERRLAEARSLHSDTDDPALPFSKETYVMVTTHDHSLDQRIVERVLEKPHRWLGLIGSRRKAELTRKRLEHKGLDSKSAASIRSPVGLAIGAETPEEIAIAIVAELIAERRGVAPSNIDGALPIAYETKRDRHGT